MGRLYKIIEKMERKRKIKNIIIKGLVTVYDKGPELAREIEQFLAKEFDVYTRVVSATKRTLHTIVARLDTVRDKLRVLHRKRQTSNKKIPVYIGPDLTETEVQIQTRIARRAFQERLRGNHVKMGYKTMYVNDVKYGWDPKLDKLVQVMHHLPSKKKRTSLRLRFG